MIIFHVFDDKKEIEVLKYPFEVREGLPIQLTIMDGCFEHVPIIIRDPKQQIRGLYTLKTRIKTHFIDEGISGTSNGGLAGKILGGQWTLEIVKPSFRVTGNIQLELRQDRKLKQLNEEQQITVLNQPEATFNPATDGDAKWLRGELHCHSYYSDGRVSFEDIIAEAERQKIDVIALMDHSIVSTQFLKSNSLVIPGTEITLDNEVHYNVYGVKELIDYPSYFESSLTKNQGLDRMFADLAAKGYLLSINHPFADGMGLRHDFDMTPFRFLEVMNAPHLVDEFIDNEKAIRFFDYLWIEGHYVFGLGGSDAHKKNYHNHYPLGIPKNRIHAQNQSLESVLSAMMLGHLFIENEFSCEIQFTGAHGENILPGMEYEGKLKMTAKGDSEVVWQVIDNGQCVDCSVGKSCSFDAVVRAGHFIRLEALRDDAHALFVNPVYGQLKQEKSIHSFAELVQSFEQINKIKKVEA